MSWAGPEDVYLSTSLASYLDTNAVLEGACERVIVGDLYCDIPLGLYVIRGENVVLIGELDSEREELPPHMTRVSAAEIKRAQKAEREASDLKAPALLALLLCVLSSEASVHEYAAERFATKGSAFAVHGGSEGIYSSASTQSASVSASGDSYIRLRFGEDRETIGGSAYSGQRAVCCSGDLAKLGVCAQGEIIHRPSTENPGWPQYARFWREVFPLQNCITLGITLGMFEMALWYFESAEFNETGVRPTGITAWAVTFGTVKCTVARVILLMVSMGYGVVRPSLGGLTSKVILLGLTFFLASEVLEMVENVGAVSDLSGKARLFLVLPVAILDAFFILWIFTSLSATLNKLQARRMMVKLDIYRKFTNALAVTVIVSVGWICYELYFKSNDVYNEQWQNAWIIPAFWQVLSFTLLFVVCILWAPSQTSTRYAYSGDSEEFDKDDTTLTLVKPALTPAKDAGSALETRPLQGSNGASNGGDEEDKIE
ncbi:hypothetical protein ACFX1S_024937 [Malus domestica]